MSTKKGFTMFELIVVMLIIAVLACIAIPNYLISMQQGAASAAQNNLINLYNAEKSYYFSNTKYYISSSNPDTLTNINTALGSNIADNSFNYYCSNTGGFQCTATNKSDTNLKLTLSNSSLVLPGSSCAPQPGCLNPTCQSDNSNEYCPG